MTQIMEMKKELEYPTAKEVFDRYLELAPDNDDIDEAVYDVICEWDEQFAGDATWCDDEETDVKDRLRDEVLEMLGAMNTRTEDAVINNKNTKDNRLCVVVEYYPPVAVFKIPDGLDLEDESIVKNWFVKWGRLTIEFTDGREEEIEWEYDPDGDYKWDSGEYPMGKIEDACAYGVDYSGDEDEDDED